MSGKELVFDIRTPEKYHSNEINPAHAHKYNKNKIWLHSTWDTVSEIKWSLHMRTNTNTYTNTTNHNNDLIMFH